MMYCLLYAISKGLIVTTTALQCARALHLGGVHIHQLFLVPTEDNIPLYRRAELAILRLFKNPTKLDFLCSMQILFIDEMGQMDDTMLAILDIILRKVKKSNIYMGGVLLMFTMDHLQIKPINGRPFLTSANIIPCFKMVNLQHSMRAWDDQRYQRIQQLG